MANEEYLTLLKQGVEAWNEWRVKNPDIKPDLSAANLRKAKLKEVNFSGADLRNADLWGADLSEADFIQADLSAATLCESVLRRANLSGAHFIAANLSKANLNRANLSEAVLSGANLDNADLDEAVFTGAILSRACLSRARLRGVNLSGANLSETILSGAIFSRAVFGGSSASGFEIRAANLSGACLYTADLSGTDLSGTNLSGALLYRANLNRANLSRTNLSGADLRGADLREAIISEVILSGATMCEVNLSGLNISQLNLSGFNFSGANLKGASFVEANFNKVDLSESDLSGSDLCRMQVLETDFTGAILTGACIEDWHINNATNLSDVICEFIYLRQGQKERRPRDINRKFAPGEFTKLYQKAQDTVDLIFSDGIDWKAFLLSFKELKEEYGDDNLSVQAIEKKGGSSFVIRLEVSPEVNKTEFENQAKERYQLKLNLIEERYRAELKAKDEQLLAFYRQHSATLENIIYMLGNRPIENIIQNINDVTAKAESKSMSESYQSKYDQKNSNNQFVDTAQPGSNLTFNQHNFSQNINQSIDDITRLINSLREKAQDFPQDKREEALVHLDDLQEDISKPEKRKPERVKTRIIGLITIAGTVFGVVANSADFTNNVLELADKLGIEISQPQQPSQQLPPSTH